MNSSEKRFIEIQFIAKQSKNCTEIMCVNQMIQLNSTWLQTQQSALVDVVMLLSGLENEWT